MTDHQQWEKDFDRWAKHHRTALDMNTAQAVAMMNIWRDMWMKPVKEGGRIIAYRGLRPTLDELMAATDWMVECEPETAWAAMYKAINGRVQSERRKAAKRDEPRELKEEIDENKGGLAKWDMKKAMEAIGKIPEDKP